MISVVGFYPGMSLIVILQAG
eukprot:SAG22_NODE_2120_length_2981_cov_1.324080_8_plen_20_part_01